MTTPASNEPPPDPRQGGRGTPDGMEPDALLASVKALLEAWALEDMQLLDTRTKAPLQPGGSRSGQGAASVLPYLIALLKGRH